MKRKVYYVETGMGAGIRLGKTETQVRRNELEKVGTYHGVQIVRIATKEDIENVKSMNGYIPKLARAMQEGGLQK